MTFPLGEVAEGGREVPPYRCQWSAASYPAEIILAAYRDAEKGYCWSHPQGEQTHWWPLIREYMIVRQMSHVTEEPRISDYDKPSELQLLTQSKWWKVGWDLQNTPSFQLLLETNQAYYWLL